ncbi:MAG: hypothetical protein RLN63_03680, partial [Miltoncostaeaceae bacterium]
VRFLHPGMNLGWAGGVHHARRRIGRPLMWLIQDDMTVLPGCLEALLARLAQRPELVAVRPVVVDRDGVVPLGQCGMAVDGDGAPHSPVPPVPTPPADLVLPDRPDYLPSSGLLIRLEAWDAVGGMNPWLYPVGLADVDLGQALRARGADFALVHEARVRHPAHRSTPSVLGGFCVARNAMILRAAWFPHALPPAGERRGLISDQVLDAAVARRRSAEPLDDEDLRTIAGAAAADALVRLSGHAERELAGLRDAYEATRDARDWWREQHAAADRAWREASGRGESTQGS